ncbi:CgeB family protein [Sphingomicrobium clamense]|uniref:Glycosyltransferase n=1 Tax=Sphingomicrobium clamense TaxID=2851013 RepID=A0ABS6V6U6_9SPHN|nr:glycosyltransferase [Sphingomicrobium sp. B8]MBW0145211.1 glycosyltransferase [Sphingomicrobium sp. B8]
MNGGEFANLRVALIADDLTRECLEQECRVANVTPFNAWAVLHLWKPDLLFVESSWKGRRERWRYKIAAYPDHPNRSNRTLAKVVAMARDLDIPCIFWNREDGVHFDRFIDSAKLFDRVLTVDDTMVPRYREVLGPDAKVDVMMFAASSALHFPKPVEKEKRAAFVGSYSSHIHHDRRAWQDMMFEASRDLGLTVYDRNSDRKPDHYRFPDLPWIEVRPAVPHRATSDIYRRFAVNLNVNTITGSTTAFSRRLVEILACGGVTATNPTPAVEQHFGEYCEVVSDIDHAEAYLGRIARDGLTTQDIERAGVASDYVLTHHVWTNRVAQIVDFAAI